MTDTKRVYLFGNGQAEGKADMKNLLGGKGANLAEMNLIGLPVPPGFTITTDTCNEYTKLGRDAVSALLKSEVEAAIRHLEKLMNMEFGSDANPLLLSVRSGARASMPGMMDTILNLGITTKPCRASSRRPATNVSPGIAIAASCKCTETWCWASNPRPKRKKIPLK